MNIGFSGCSFTHGTELQNIEESRYSRVVARELGATEYNVSRRGNPIDLIMKNMYDLTNQVDLDFAVIQITSYSRLSYAYENSYNILSSYQTKFVSNEDRNFNLFLYSSNTEYKMWYEMQRWKIFTMHEYLNKKNIPHLFLFMGLDESRLFEQDSSIPETLVWHKTPLRSFCIENNYPIGVERHPLELGHEMIAKRIVIPYIRIMT